MYRMIAAFVLCGAVLMMSANDANADRCRSRGYRGGGYYSYGAYPRVSNRYYYRGSYFAPRYGGYGYGYGPGVSFGYGRGGGYYGGRGSYISFGFGF